MTVANVYDASGTQRQAEHAADIHQPIRCMRLRITAL
jgi:hypothetical protein